MVLVACSGAEEATLEPMAAESDAGAVQMTYDGGPVVGVYEAVSTEGIVLTQDTKADGTIATVDGDGNASNSTYTFENDRFCITSEGAADAACYAYSDLQDDGSWTATNVDDASDVWTLKRVEGR